MKQEKINRAFPSLTKLRDMNLPINKARAIYRLYVAAEEAYNFAFNEEQKYLNEFNGTLVEDGGINFKTPEDCSAFQKRFDELINSEIGLEIEPVTLSDKDVGNQMLTPGDIYNLEGFVIFE